MKLLFLLLVLSVTVVFAQKSPAQKFALSELEFMAGNWKTSSQWGDMDEVWSKPSGNCMMCSYRCVKNGKVVFYEFVLIEQNESDSVPVMKLRHFSPGSVGWEDKNSPNLYPMISIEGKKATFRKPDGSTTLSYERTGPTSLKAVLIQEKEGKKSATEFNFSELK